MELPINISEIISYEFSAKWYKEILEIFDFDQKRDLYARDILWKYRKRFDLNKVLLELIERVKNKTMFFFGAGPSLEIEITQNLKSLKEKRKRLFITSADGASRALLENNIIPDFIVSDLDGLSFEEINYFTKRDVIISIHAHGDNINKLNSFERILQDYDYIIGTTQTDARYPIINPGGFTDGDRGLFLFDKIIQKEKKFYLIGYENKNIIGKYSKPNYLEEKKITTMKKKKLMFCEKLIKFLVNSEHRKIIFINSNNNVNNLYEILTVIDI